MNPDTLTGLYGNESTPTPSGLASPEQDVGGASFGGGLDLGVNPARKRRSATQNALLALADVFNISASRPNLFGQAAIEPGSAYLGQSEERANALQKIRAEEDLEGYQIDLNRAKVLSQRAADTDDQELKKKYGAAIKKLLPDETQGLDDLTASDFFNSMDNKLKLEQLKGYNKLQQIAAQNQGRMDVATANNETKAAIAAQKVTAQLQMNALDNQIREAIAEGKNDTALALQDKRFELQSFIHQLDNAADYEREIMKQEYATERTNIQQGGANYRANLSADTKIKTTEMQQKGAMDRVQVQQANANLRAIVAPKGEQDAKAQQANAMVNYLTSDAQVAEFDRLNMDAGQFSWGGEAWNTLRSTERGQKWSQLESYMTRGIVQLAKSLGSNPSNEDAKRISKMFGLDSHMSPAKRREAWFSTLQYVAATAGSGLPTDGTIPVSDVAALINANAGAGGAANNVAQTITGQTPGGQSVLPNGNIIF